MELVRNREFEVRKKSVHRKVCGKSTSCAIPLLLLFFLFPSAFSLAASATDYGRGESGVVGTPLVRGRGESGVVGTPLSFGRGESGVVGTPLVRGRGESGVVGTPLANAMAALVAATATIVTISERKRRAFDDITPP
jgi:hypothetical protein